MLTSRDIAVIALCAAFWSSINVTLAPVFWQLTRLPILCDLLAMISLMLGVWWVKRPGAATAIGLLATLLNFIMRPTAIHFLGFTIASMLFDAATFLAGYRRLFSGAAGLAALVAIGIASTWVAGLVIGSAFSPDISKGGASSIIAFSILHAAGGLIGGLVAVSLIGALKARKVEPGKAG